MFHPKTLLRDPRVITNARLTSFAIPFASLRFSDDYETNKTLITRKNFIKEALRFYGLYLKPLPLPNVTTLLTYMITSGNYVPSTDWTYGQQVDVQSAEVLLKVGFNHECASPANVAAIFFRTSPGLDDYNNMDFAYAQDLAKTTRASIEGSINNDENTENADMNQLPDSFYPQGLEGWPDPPQLETGDTALVMASDGDNDGGSEEDGYIQLSPASRSRSKRRRVKTLSNQTRFIVDRRVTERADLLAPVESNYIV